MSFQLTSADNVTTGSQYRMYLTPYVSASGTGSRYLDPVWHGSLQVFASQSFNFESKSVYTNQIPVGDTFKSNVSTNEYIILT
jgi:aspartate-semialdehyde dehydrogenase